MDGYFLTADLLGFRNIVKNSSDDELSARVTKWISLVEASATDPSVRQIQLISDTVFAACESSAEGLSAIVSFARSLLQNGASASLPVRGAITHGSFEWGKLTYGKAVIKSHQLESNQDWIGIACDNAMPHLESMWHHDRLICYPPPLKTGSVMLSPVVAWDVPAFEELTAALTSNGLTSKGEHLSWPWAQKVRNTVEFGVYLKMVRESKIDPGKFVGLLPIQLIALNVQHQERNA